MDKVGYTWGSFAEINQKSWASRLVISSCRPCRTSIPSMHTSLIAANISANSNCATRCSRFPVSCGLMGLANRATMGSYAEAVALPINSPNYPDITLTRKVRTNYGFVANLEQAITQDLGIFSRTSWDAGQTEKMAGLTATGASLLAQS